MYARAAGRSWRRRMPGMQTMDATSAYQRADVRVLTPYILLNSN
jgi:hypothetical protein